MEQDYPKFIYKYRPIENTDDLKKDYSLDALLNNQAIFSSRTNFNDLFDSKIELVKPSPKEVKELSKRLPKYNRLQLKSHIDKGRFTPEGEDFLTKLEGKINERINAYGFMSLSSIPTSNLMWSHYARSHSGFCIEFRTEHIRARKVEYGKNIPSLPLIDLYGIFYEISTDDNLGHRILDMLHLKLEEWGYESEYRYLAGNQLATIPHGSNFAKVPYENEFVESIIFGYRMAEAHKEYIIKNMPNGTKFKQATIGKNAMKIVDYKSEKR